MARTKIDQEGKKLVKINASAGSGKTYTLTNNFVDLLFNSDLAPCESCKISQEKQIKFNFSELLAITFTNLAANQMKEKVIERLKQYAFKNENVLDKELFENPKELEEKSQKAFLMLDNIFRQYGALNIRTIDSLLNQIIGLFALELGYAPNFETVFNSDDLIEKIYLDLAEQAIHNPVYELFFQELCAYLINEKDHTNFFAKDTIKNIIKNFVNYCITNNEEFSSENLDEISAQLTFLQTEYNELEERIEKLRQELLTHIQEEKIAVKSYLLEALTKPKYDSTLLFKDSFSEVVNKASKDYDGGAIATYFALQKDLLALPKVECILKNSKLMYRIISLGSIITKELAFVEEQEQQMNTQKMPYLIASLLGNDNGQMAKNLLALKNNSSMDNTLVSAAYCRLGTRLKHILYDEFQDTSLSQWKALKDLSEEALSSGGSVLFVGDVKQAIYGWRGGKSELFDNAPQDLAQNGYTINNDALKENWRSAENIIKWNNAFFSLLKEENAPILRSSLPFLLSESTRNQIIKEEKQNIFEDTTQELNRDYAQIEQQINPKQLTKVKDKGIIEIHYLHEASSFFKVAALCLLPEMVKNLHKRYEYGKICILTLTNEQSSFVSQILLAHNIPVISQGSLGLKDHPVIVDLLAFLHFLANPLDDNAFCHVLLGEKILPQSFYQLVDRTQILEFLAERRDGISCYTHFKEVFPKAWEMYFKVMVDGAGVLTAYDTICEIYDRLQVVERNRDADVYLLRMQEIVYLAEENGIVDLNSFVTWWEENGEKEKAPLSEDMDSVSVMTVHKSKGLEFDAVIIPWHDFTIAPSGEMKKITIPYNDKEFTVYSNLKKEHGEPYYKALFEKTKENINAHYVAWTRPKCELHIFMPTNIEREKEGAGYYYNFIDNMLEELIASQKLSVTQNDDMLHFGEILEEPVLLEQTLRAVEYFLGAGEMPLGNKKPSQKIINAIQKLLDELGNIKEIKSDELYYAKKISWIISPVEKIKKEQKNIIQEKENLGIKELMGWLPDLRIFRSDLEEVMGVKELSSNKRGTLVHKGLEYFVFSNDIYESCKRATQMAIKQLPYGRLMHDTDNEQGTNLEELAQSVQEILLWFANLQEPFGGAKFWFDYGYREHAITDKNGDLFRVDLLVQIPKAYKEQFGGYGFLAVDYKTGYLDEKLPVSSNKKQMENYISLLAEATGEKVCALLVYLDVQTICLVGGEDE